MIQSFEIKPSRYVAAYIFIVHAFTLFCALSFEVSALICLSLVIAIFASMAWQIFTWARRHYFLKYEPKVQCWSISSDKHQWRRYNSVTYIYLNNSFVWLILRASGGASTSVIIGVDSMPTERYLQLRRCIICPGIFN